MPRTKLIRSAVFPYHVCARTNNKDYFPVPMPLVWNTFLHYLRVLISDYGVRIHAFVLMSNHYHLVMSTPRENIAEAMNHFQREVSKALNRASGRENHNFGGPYQRTLIVSDLQVAHTMRYVFQNPVEAGICHFVDEYAYSTLVNAPLPITPAPGFRLSGKAALDWFNRPYTQIEKTFLERALRRSEFDLKTTFRSPQIPHALT